MAFALDGPVRLCKAEVAGSIPARSITDTPALFAFRRVLGRQLTTHGLGEGIEATEGADVHRHLADPTLVVEAEEIDAFERLGLRLWR